MARDMFISILNSFRHRNVDELHFPLSRVRSHKDDTPSALNISYMIAIHF